MLLSPGLSTGDTDMNRTWGLSSFAKSTTGETLKKRYMGQDEWSLVNKSFITTALYREKATLVTSASPSGSASLYLPLPEPVPSNVMECLAVPLLLKMWACLHENQPLRLI